MLVLAAGFAASADVDLGIAQDMANNSLRMDAANFVFEVPLQGSVSQFSAGATIPTTFWNMYGVALMDFSKEASDDGEKLAYEKLNVGLGYPIEFGDFVLKGELLASSPMWTQFEEWEFRPVVSLQFSFGALKPSE